MPPDCTTGSLLLFDFVTHIKGQPAFQLVCDCVQLCWRFSLGAVKESCNSFITLLSGFCNLLSALMRLEPLRVSILLIASGSRFVMFYCLLYLLYETKLVPMLHCLCHLSLSCQHLPGYLLSFCDCFRIKCLRRPETSSDFPSLFSY
jgi:hypothetical protein